MVSVQYRVLSMVQYLVCLDGICIMSGFYSSVISSTVITADNTSVGSMISIPGSSRWLVWGTLAWGRILPVVNVIKWCIKGEPCKRKQPRGWCFCCWGRRLRNPVLVYFWLTRGFALLQLPAQGACSRISEAVNGEPWAEYCGNELSHQLWLQTRRKIFTPSVREERC